MQKTISSKNIIEYQSYKNYTSIKCPYEGSPLKMYKNMSSKRKGAAFEKIFEEFMKAQGFMMKKNYNSDHDRVFVINGKELKFEVKGSTLWGENGSSMKWQQIRCDQDYDIIIFMAILPEGIDIYWSTKETVKDVIDVQDENGHWIYNQHGGKRVRSGAFAIQGMPEDFAFMKRIETLIQ